jgi:hypothetical protein
LSPPEVSGQARAAEARSLAQLLEPIGELLALDLVRWCGRPVLGPEGGMALHVLVVADRLV